MENAPQALAGPIPAAGSLDRAPFTAWNMGKSRSSHPEIVTAQAQAAEPRAEAARERTFVQTYTLRVKPDRRRQQVPVPPEFDRRRPR
jgi:hypothetical protein